MKLLLKNWKIYDGTGNISFVGDILISEDRILKVGKNDKYVKNASFKKR